jgi:hypothetical protein
MSSFCRIYTCHIVFSYFVVTWTPERTPGQVIDKVSSLHVQFAVLGNALFDLTRLRLEPTIYHTQGEHVNLYTTDRCRLDTPFDTRSCFHISSSYLSTPFERINDKGYSVHSLLRHGPSLLTSRFMKQWPLGQLLTTDPCIGQIML